RAFQRVGGPGDRAPRTAERERRPDDRGVAHLADHLARLLDRARVARARKIETDALHRGLEELAVLRLLDRLDLRADQLHAVTVEHPTLREGHGEVEPGLPAEGGQEGIRPL